MKRPGPHVPNGDCFLKTQLSRGKSLYLFQFRSDKFSRNGPQSVRMRVMFPPD